jgi:hypothetical protein
MKHALAITLVLAAAGCRWLTEPSHVVEVSSPAEVTLKIGQDVRVDGVLRAKFVGVPADSRCPATADCIWAGDAAVAIDAWGAGISTPAAAGPSCSDTLHTTLDPKVVVCGRYSISLVELTPYPQLPGSIPASDYAARLAVARWESLDAARAP